MFWFEIDISLMTKHFMVWGVQTPVVCELIQVTWGASSRLLMIEYQTKGKVQGDGPVERDDVEEQELV